MWGANWPLRFITSHIAVSGQLISLQALDMVLSATNSAIHDHIIFTIIDAMLHGDDNVKKPSYANNLTFIDCGDHYGTNAQGSRPINTDNDLAVALAGFPLSLEQVEERTIKLPSGDSQTKIRQSNIYRDAAGRMRIEIQLSELGKQVTLIQIRDPIAGFVAMLTPDMVAHRLRTPKMNPPSGGGFAFFGTSVGSMPGKNAKTENLGRRTIEGISCDGLRITGTSEDQPPRSVVEERWASTELGLVAMIEATSPEEHYSAKILKVTRAEPDPRLFVIPKEYEIQEMGDLSKN